MKRFAVGLFACLCLLPSTAGAVDRTSDADSDTPVGRALSDFPSACPEMTDSIYRLYTAYFRREPDAAGWDYWFLTYGSGFNTNLEVISAAFADSQEFRNTYGSLSNPAFVNLVYANVLGRAPDPAGFNHWTSVLDRGYSRGSVMIAFSESAEYVAQTGTRPPMGGVLQWYDRSLELWCEVLDVPAVIPIPTNIPTAHVDILVESVDDVPIEVRVTIRRGAVATATETITLPPNHYTYYWNTPLDPGEDSILVETTGTYGYTIAFYDHPHSANRPPWDGFGGTAGNR